MKFTIKPGDPAKLDVDLLISFGFSDDLASQNSIHKLLKFLPGDFLKTIEEEINRINYSGDAGENFVSPTRSQISPYKLQITGLGSADKFDLFRLQKSVGNAISRALSEKPAKIALIIPDKWLSDFPTQKVVSITVTAINKTAYKFLKYKSDQEKNKIRNIEHCFICVPGGKITQAEDGVAFGVVVSSALCYARDLVNEPAMVTTPSFLAGQAQTLAKNSKGKLKVKVLEAEEAKKSGMEAYLGVARASHEPPKFIILKYRGANPKKKITLIGKGITFDTGGLSIKSSQQMETMKLDMSGAAAILAVMQALPAINSPYEVTGIIPACENMPGGKALKPGDILRTMNGTTIEVLNTDAEGRLTLADAISYAVIQEKPDEIIDLATLTGACMVALGEDVAGLWSNNDLLLGNLVNAAKNSVELVWGMPLVAQYKDLIKSHIADLKNIQTGRYGGAITAALFLAEFTGKIPWAHLDIAGPAFAQKDSVLVPQGGTGFGVAMLLEYLQ